MKLYSAEIEHLNPCPNLLYIDAKFVGRTTGISCVIDDIWIGVSGKFIIQYRLITGTSIDDYGILPHDTFLKKYRYQQDANR